MKIPLHLLLLLLIAAGGCKIAPPMYPPSGETDISHTTTSDYYGEDYDEYTEDDYGAKTEVFESKQLVPEEYLVLVHNTKEKTDATGLRVLPNIIVTALPVIGSFQANDFVIYFKNRKGTIMRRKVFNSFVSSADDRQFGFLSTRRKPVRVRSVGFRTIPLVTRTDSLESLQCIAVVMLPNLTISKHEVALHHKPDRCNASRICAEPTKRVCHDPEGMALMCHNRLSGIRIDNVSCVGPSQVYVFSNVRYHDYWAIDQLYPRGYFDYHIKSRYLRSVATLGHLETLLYRLASNVLFLYYQVRNKLL